MCLEKLIEKMKVLVLLVVLIIDINLIVYHMFVELKENGNILVYGYYISSRWLIWGGGRQRIKRK
jgi:hypothetical protein